LTLEKSSSTSAACYLKREGDRHRLSQLLPHSAAPRVKRPAYRSEISTGLTQRLQSVYFSTAYISITINFPKSSHQVAGSER